MDAQEHEELRILKRYNKYLNEDGSRQLINLWNKKEREDEIRKREDKIREGKRI